MRSIFELGVWWSLQRNFFSLKIKLFSKEKAILKAFLWKFLKNSFFFLICFLKKQGKYF
jgi:hypothetical protein